MSSLTRPLSAELREAIEQTYLVFERYRLSGALTVCRCNICMDEDTERELIATPLREISSQLLAEYTNSAHGWNDGTIASDMRYFLPRYLELIALDDPPEHSLGLGMCLRRLGEGTWRSTWPAEEVEAISRYFDALATFTIARCDARYTNWDLGDTSRFMELLELVARAGGDIRRLLRTWDAAPDPAAAIEMAAARSSVVTDNGSHRLETTWLADLPAENECIGTFLMQPSVARRIAVAAETTSEEWPLEVLARELLPDMPGGRQTR